VSTDDRNRRFYGTVSAGRDDYWRKMAAPRFRVETLLSLLAERPPRRLVDLGCGGGQLLEALRRAWPSARLMGVDLSEAQLAADRRALPGVDLVAADLDAPEAVSALAPHEGAFDTVVAMELIEHVASPAAVLRTALRLATPGEGRLLLSTQSGPLRETERRVGHRRHFTAREMHALLVETGWRPERVWQCGFPFHDLSKRLANLRPDAAMARFDGRAYGPVEDALCLALRALFRLNSGARGAQLFAVARRA
jgi:2-polyprenyl-3-methyl-5-hydroxy-6-metoxy-1,4-benzoquinol methylase